MARIIDSIEGGRRIIKLSTMDIISIVQEYQQIVGIGRDNREVHNILDDNAIFIPEDM